MKHFTLLCGCAALAVAASAATPAPRSARTMPRVGTVTAKKSARTSSVTATPGATRFCHAPAGVPRLSDWQPAHVQMYYYSQVENENEENPVYEWIADENITYTYNAAGLPLTARSVNAEGSINLTTSTYTEYGYKASELQQVAESGADELTNSSRIARTYDSRIHSLIVDNLQESWIDGAWSDASNTYRRNITRNADGNITLCEVAVLWDGIYDPTIRIAVTYGADGKAVKIVKNELTLVDIDADYNFIYDWVVTEQYDNIVWQDTDGQIATTEDFTVGTNRIKSCDLSLYDAYSDAMQNYKLEISYNADNEDYVATYTGVGDMEGYTNKEAYTVTDEYGSYKLDIVATFEYESGEMESMLESYAYKVDAWDNLLLEEDIIDYGDGDIEVNRMVGEVESDTVGRPAVYTQSMFVPAEDEEGDEDIEYMSAEEIAGTMEPMLKIEFSDYVDVTAGVADIAADNAAAPVELYDLRGVRVQGNPAPGLYIRRQGSAVTKVFVR